MLNLIYFSTFGAFLQCRRKRIDRILNFLFLFFSSETFIFWSQNNLLRLTFFIIRKIINFSLEPILIFPKYLTVSQTDFFFLFLNFFFPVIHRLLYDNFFDMNTLLINNSFISLICFFHIKFSKLISSACIFNETRRNKFL